MAKKQEVLNELLKKIDECDDLIVEISQIRYWLDDVVKQLKHKKGSGTPVRTGVRSKQENFNNNSKDF